ncbi:MAG: NADH:ubiquinone oxidoreductase subunit A [Chloroflexi bacterium RBG_16_51_9]|nr:MAG: NADH:ubiquinone oxidoreductase subunit A [Chloroflexi bacterium RBG_16_51_9]
MLTNYGYIGLYLIAAVLFTLLMLGIPIILRLLKVVPHHPNPIKNSTFECGVETIGKTWVQFNFRYYFYALVFVAMDVLVVFLYPWAVGLKTLGYAGLVGIVILVSIVVVGYIYAWKKKALQWQ